MPSVYNGEAKTNYNLRVNVRQTQLRCYNYKEVLNNNHNSLQLLISIFAHQ